MQNVRATLGNETDPTVLTLLHTLLRRLFCSLSRRIKFNETTQTTVAVFSERYRVHPSPAVCRIDTKGWMREVKGTSPTSRKGNGSEAPGYEKVAPKDVRDDR